MLERAWVPVGKGVKTQEEVDALAMYLFDDEQGEEELLDPQGASHVLQGG